MSTREWDDKERIVASAVMFNGMIVTMPAPARHHTILMPLTEAMNEGVETDDPKFRMVGLPEEQGFLTSIGRFVGRIEARDIAVQNMGVNPSYGSYLYSEDLW